MGTGYADAKPISTSDDLLKRDEGAREGDPFGRLFMDFGHYEIGVQLNGKEYKVAVVLVYFNISLHNLPYSSS